MKETADRGLARRERIEQLEKFGEEAKKNLAKTEQRLKIALADHDLAKDEIEYLRHKNEFLSKVKDCDVRKISHDARKRLRGMGKSSSKLCRSLFLLTKLETNLNPSEMS